MESLWLDLRYGFRMLIRTPSFTIVAVGVLAVGIAAGTAIFSVVNAVLLRPLPYSEPDRLLLVQESLPKLYMHTGAVSAAEYWDYKDGNEVFSNIACFTTENLNLTGQGEASRIQVARVSASLFSLLGGSPKIGRTFTEDEDKPGANAVVMISERLWRARFGSDSDIAGQSVKLDEKSYTVIGVMPARFQFPSTDNTFSDAVDLWVPLAMSDEDRGRRADSFDYGVIGRLKPGVSIEQARSDIQAIAGRMQQAHPDAYKGNVEIAADVIGLDEEMVKPVRTVLLVLLGAVGLVLLVGCANVANLLLARSQTRVKEMAIRTAVGASSGRLIRQLMIESLLLSILGGGAGIASCVVGGRSYRKVWTWQCASTPRSESRRARTSIYPRGFGRHRGDLRTGPGNSLLSSKLERIAEGVRGPCNRKPRKQTHAWSPHCFRDRVCAGAFDWRRLADRQFCPVAGRAARF